MRTITLLRAGNRIVVEPTTDRVYGLLVPELTYKEKKFFKGYALKQRLRNRQPPFEEVTWQCFQEDHRGRIGTSFGFRERIEEALGRAGYAVELRWATDALAAEAERRAAAVYAPRWDKIEEYVARGFAFKYGQREVLEVMAAHENGRIDCPTGWGKGTEIVLFCKLLPKASIAVVTRNVAVLHQRLYPELAQNLPSVGLVGGGRKVMGRRVMCYTAGSLGYADPDTDVVLFDECHQAAADKTAEKMGVFRHARMYGLSATHGMRLDNKDMRCEAMFGPVRYRITYQEAQEAGVVVPVEVLWSDVITDVNPCVDLVDWEKDRAGVWAHDYRNDVVAADAGGYPDDVQVLVVTNTLEHALNLKKRLPDFRLVYAPQMLKDSDLRYYEGQGLLDALGEPLTRERLVKRTRLFEEGRLKRVIATTVWNVGVNFKQLQVLVRADAGGAPINDVQIPGRTSRTVDGKDFAVIHDYRDQFDAGFRSKARGREKTYASMGWTQHYPGREGQTLLRRQMGWGRRV